jgi:hypothetical protein
VATPLIVPVGEIVKPGGRAPELMVKLEYGAVPPEPMIVWLYD